MNIYLTQKNTNHQIAELPFNFFKANETISDELIIYPEHKQQKFMGFGASITESSSSIYKSLNSENKSKLMEAFFSSKGNNYNFTRTHINSCDFSLGNYSYVQNNDIQLNSFDIGRDKISLIPMIKDAIKLRNSDLKILSSPWSPPFWMKTNNQMNNGGKLKKEFQSTWAEYFCKYINEYKINGIEIWGVTVQNEPEAKQVWDSCLYSPEEERDFVKNFLGPAFEKNKLTDTKIIICDHNRDIMIKRAKKVFEDPIANKYTWGTGFHWYNGDNFHNVKKLHDMYPDKHLIFTEGCQEGGTHDGSWKLGERYANSIINDLNNWTEAWIDWNIVLNHEGGPNHVSNFCSASLIIDKENEFNFQNSYYYMGHFSRFIQPGDYIVKSEINNNNLSAVCSVDSNSNLTSVILNDKEIDQSIKIKYDNIGINLKVPSNSILTIKL